MKYHKIPLFDNNKGFTLVELSIVMIIVGLLIGGVFGGMKLVENAQVSKTIQDLKAIETATLTFRDTSRYIRPFARRHSKPINPPYQLHHRAV